MSEVSRDVVHVSAPAKVNLTLHVTGQRDDGYHLLDSLVVFASEAADHLTLRRASATSLEVSGPRAPGVPEDARNLCWRAADAFGQAVDMKLEKHLPHAAGIGGGSSDAAAVLRGLQQLTGKALALDAARLGADVPVCLAARATRMRGIGDILTPQDIPTLHGVLINPGVDVPTPAVFKALPQKNNPAMTDRTTGDFMGWLGAQRNDLQDPAISLAPAISECLDALSDAQLARMSGSGATCFGLYPSAQDAKSAAARIKAAAPNWWVVASPLI